MRNLFFIVVIIVFLVVMIRGIFAKGLKRPTRAVLLIIPLPLTVAALLWWTFPAWEYPITTGLYNAASVNCTYTDENHIEPYESDGSHRWLNLVIWYPKDYSGDRNTCPVIIFSHGSFGMKESNVSLYRELASHGYVVFAVDHTYQCLSTTDADGKKVTMDKRYRQQILSASDSSEESRVQLYHMFEEWMRIRMGDIAFVLDTIIARAAANNTDDQNVYCLADPTRIGVMGHSLGGAAALGMGRTRTDIRAVIALEAPFMYDVEDVAANGFRFSNEPYPVPVLNVYTDSSWNILAKSPQYAQNHKLLDDQSDLTEELYVQGAGHMTLTDLALSTPPLCIAFGQDLFFNAEEHVRSINQEYLAFFNRYLKN